MFNSLRAITHVAIRRLQGQVVPDHEATAAIIRGITDVGCDIVNSYRRCADRRLKSRA